MQRKLDYLRNVRYIMIPKDFTYLDHHTSYMPKHIKERFEGGKYLRNWDTIPTDEFTVRREMSFVERDQRIKDTLDYNHPLSDTGIMYTLPDYSKPFCIRVIIPRLKAVLDGKFNVSDDYKSTIVNINYGYGDYRHAKLADGERIIIIGNAMEDEISGKQVDVFYGVRECDFQLYFDSVQKAIKEGYSLDSSPDLSQGKYSDYFKKNYVIRKSMNMERYLGSPSEFEMELMDDYREHLPEYGPIPKLPINDHLYYYRLYNDYANKGSLGMK